MDTGCCDKKTYKALVKSPEIDIILPSIVAMVDKPTLILEVLTADGANNNRARTFEAQCALSANCKAHSWIHKSQHPAHIPSPSELATAMFNVPTISLMGILADDAPLRSLKNVTWPMCLLKERHMQIQFILQESDFLLLQRRGFKWNLHYNEKFIHLCFTLKSCSLSDQGS
jgi:hypothetical protein